MVNKDSFKKDGLYYWKSVIGNEYIIKVIFILDREINFQVLACSLDGSYWDNDFHMTYCEMAEKILVTHEVGLEELPLYIRIPFKSEEFENLLKGELV